MRVGLVGYNAPTGLGELNRQIATYADVDRWLVKPHAKHGTKDPHPDVDTTICPNGNRVTRWLKHVDAVVFCETPYYPNLSNACRVLGKRMVCVPMQEWMPGGAKGWAQDALLICPTGHCYQQFAHVANCANFPWPVDTDRFKFKPRKRCSRFVFINGGGGWNGRKGAAVVRRAVKLWPEIPLTVFSQVQDLWPPGVDVRRSPKNNADLYRDGDILIAPHSVDGLGLEPHEAMASGMPVIVTDGRPWNENPAIARIPCSVEKRKVRRPVDWHLPDAAAMVEICKGLLGKDIIEESQTARDWAESRSWAKHADKFNRLVREA